MTENVVAILQARTSSTRLPGKVLKPILGREMLALQIERIKHAKSLSGLIVATSEDESDNAIEALCDKLEVRCFRGSLNDVLDRFYQASKLMPSEHYVRLTGDCPLIDGQLIDQMIALHKLKQADYTSNSVLPNDPKYKPTMPDGLDIEIMTTETLHNAWENAHQAFEREHVTAYIRMRPQIFKLHYYQHKPDLSSYRWTVDEPEDFRLISQIFGKLYPVNPEFSWLDVLELIETDKSLSQINQQIIRDEGFLSSLNNNSQ